MALGAARYDMARFGFEVHVPARVRLIWLWYAEQSPIKWLRYWNDFTTRARSEVCGCRRRMRCQRRSFQEVLSRSKRGGQDSSGRCIYSRMPATSWSILLWHDAIATQSENRKVLWWSKQKREETGLFKKWRMMNDEWRIRMQHPGRFFILNFSFLI